MGTEEIAMDADLRSRVVQLEHKHAAHDQRLTDIDRRLTKADIEDARKEEQWKNLLEKFVGVDKKLDKITGYLVSIVMAIILSILGALMAYMIKGGFHIP